MRLINKLDGLDKVVNSRMRRSFQRVNEHQITSRTDENVK